MNGMLLAAMLIAAGAAPVPLRPVAPVVSASWSNEAARDAAGEARDVVRIAGIVRGMTVADIGAGGGYYTMRVAPLLGPRGRLLAQDIDPRTLQLLERRVRKARLHNVQFLIGNGANARLPIASTDVALMVHMYHEIAQPYLLLERLRPSLKPGGRIVIVDLDRPSEDHGMPKALLTCEVRTMGYDLVSLTDITQGYVAVFKPGKRPDPASVRACRG
ncbi:methyltransferase domain-containing protein [Sandarakinorhabdus sp.]|uniref:class I SAM-dependent methyltransferase n=1 Tax=Sandarakinorhabdus sp. TaxID=1916663 RepID=UPI00286E720E|nr:methyltransferase domain-containing protein [Sandarakinorhabdus sp.]